MFDKKPPQKARAEGVPHVRDTADAYNRQYKLTPIRRHSEPHPLYAEFGQRTAREYERLPSGAPKDRASRNAYDAFARETEQQHQFALAQGYTFEPSESEPYAEPGSTKMEQMRADVRENNHLKAYSSQLNHPHLSNKTNLQFRFVHDLFGHAQEGNSIGPRGEYNAAISHSQMYSKKARPAMLAETHGQNSVVNFSESRPPELGGKTIAEANKEKPGSYYAEQKATILPRNIMREFERSFEGPKGFGRAIRRG